MGLKVIHHKPRYYSTKQLYSKRKIQNVKQARIKNYRIEVANINL